MSNATISVDIELNASKALENVNTFSDGVKGKMSEIDQVINNTNENLSNIQSTQSFDPRIKGAADVFSVLTNSLSEMKNGLTEVSKVISSGNIANSMTGMFESIYRTITSSMQKINDYTI